MIAASTRMIEQARELFGPTVVITDPAGVSRIERFATSEQVHDRWLELHRHFENEGWWGPATQDGRG